MTVKVTFQDGTPRLKALARKAGYTALSKASAYIWTVAKNSIRKTKAKPSAPGKPPHTRKGVMKHAIAFNVDESRQVAVIGPTRSELGLIGRTHEFGGTERPGETRGRKPNFSLVIGGTGPVRNLSAEGGRAGKQFRLTGVLRPWKKNDRLVVVELKTEHQVERARQIAATIPPSAGGPASKKTRVYPARPFMGPALTRSIPRIPSYWANSIKGG